MPKKKQQPTKLPLTQKVYLAPGRVVAIPAAGLDDIKMQAYRVRLVGDPELYWYRTAATGPVHAAYRMLWSRPGCITPGGVVQAIVESQFPLASKQTLWCLDLEVVPAVLSCVMMHQDAKTNTEGMEP